MIILMDALEISRYTGHTRKEIYENFRKRGIAGISQAGAKFKLFPVSEAVKSKKPVVEEGYVSANDLAEMFGMTVEQVRIRLGWAKVQPEHMGWGARMMYLKTPSLISIVKASGMVYHTPQASIHADALDAKKQYGEEIGDMINQERMKRNWVGRKGRIVEDGVVTAEGRIDAANIMGVVIDGVPGFSLRHLELVDTK